MTQLKIVDKQFLNTFREELNEDLESLAKKYGITLRAGSCTYEPNIGFTFKLEGKLPLDAKAQATVSNSYGFPPIGTTFKSNFKCFTVIEYAPSRPKYPIIAKDGNGKRFKFPVHTVNALMGK